jgi:hypothetical protein
VHVASNVEVVGQLTTSALERSLNALFDPDCDGTWTGLVGGLIRTLTRFCNLHKNFVSQ